jgi:hypothetical protein
MNTLADKSNTRSSRAVANTFSGAQLKSEPAPELQLADDAGPEVTLLKPQQLANISPQAREAASRQAMANRFVAQRRENAQHSLPAGPLVVQRALGADDKATFMEWVNEQAEARNIHVRCREALRSHANYVSTDIGAITTIEGAKLRMEAGDGFPKFVARSRLFTLADGAERSEGITVADVEAVLNYLGSARVQAFLGNGQTVHIRPLPAGEREKVCHHYAFGGLSGNDDQFTYAALDGRFHFDDLANNADIDASVIPGVGNGGPYVVRSYGWAHSSREEDGRVWHKFNGVPSLFAIPDFPDVGNGLVKTFNVRSSAAAINGEGTFRLPN